jgi:transcriptional regulator with XRE-family HTH domain
MQAFSVSREDRPYNWAMPGGRPSKSNQRTEFGERLRNARLAKGLSQNQIAQTLGVTQPSYADWERNAVSLKPEYLPKLSEALGVSVDHLLGIEQRRGRKSNGPTGKLRRLFEEANNLPRYQQQRVIAIVEDMLVAQRAKTGA